MSIKSISPTRTLVLPEIHTWHSGIVYNIITGFTNPANTTCWPDAGLIMTQRRRRWASISPALDQRVVLAYSLYVRAAVVKFQSLFYTGSFLNFNTAYICILNLYYCLCIFHSYSLEIEFVNAFEHIEWYIKSCSFDAGISRNKSKQSDRVESSGLYKITNTILYLGLLVFF